MRLRHLAEVNPSTPGFSSLGPDAPVTFVPLEAVWPDGRLDLGRLRRRDEVEVGYTRFQSGDVLVPKITPTFEAGRSAVAAHVPTDVAAGTTELHVLRPRQGVDARFLCYVTRAKPFLNEGRAAMTGVAGQQRVSDVFVRDFQVAALCGAEQRAIADFLDVETARIDHAVQLEQRLAGLTQQRLAARVERALLPSRNVLDQSGQGELPLGWRYVRLKAVMGEVIDLSVDGSEELLSVSHLSGVTPRSEKNVTMTMAESLAGYKRVRSDDLVVNTLWAWMGAAGISRYHGIVSPAYGVYRPISHRVEPAYLDYLVRTRPFGELMTRYSKGVWTSRLRLYADELLGLRVALPSRSEQQRLVTLLDKESIRTNHVRELVSRSVGLLAERKQALITAVVTGQLDLAREIAEEAS